MAERSRQADMIWCLLQKIAALLSRIRELEAKLNEDSSTSNQPPSGDPPYTRSRKKKRWKPPSEGLHLAYIGYDDSFAASKNLRFHPSTIFLANIVMPEVYPYPYP